MKHLTTILAAALLLAAPMSRADVKREHRAVWCSAFLSEWPSGALTSDAAAKRQLSVLQKQLDTFKAHNVNVVYFHVRSHCDATYESSYEPWAASVGGARGTKPVIDPFKTMLDECHARGIECYAWVNPYRYAGKTLYGGGDFNYEVTHPEWLLTKAGSETILNPALPEVQQRIVDVCREIITKYDCDGLIFDDYFYTSGTPASADADLYDAYKAAGGKAATYMDWRRENVNTMVRKVGEMIAQTKPYLNFAISPAGRCNPPTATSEYGLPDSGMGDWQYGGIASDPCYWLKHHLIDMVSPQLYWSFDGGFGDNSAWWIMAANKFGRNISVSADMSVINNNAAYNYDMLVQQQLFVRDLQMPDYSGLSIFSWKPYVNYREKDENGTSQCMTYFLNQTVYQNVALQPMRPWRNVVKPEMVSDIKLDGSALSWKAAEAGRYTIYAIPSTLSDKEFCSQPEYLLGVSYTNSYEIPQDKASGYRFAVAVYDRYGNEYAPLMMGATASKAAAPKLIAPAPDGRYAPLGDFSWENTAQRYVVEFAEDNDKMDMAEVVAIFEVTEPRLSSGAIKVLDPERSYLWRVTASGPNALEAASEVRRFYPPKMEILYPTTDLTNVPEAPTFTFTQAAEGAKYTLEISTAEKFNSITFSGESSVPSLSIPVANLSTGTTYYARVTASKGDNSFVSDIVKFRTLDVEYTEAPQFLCPSADQSTLYSNTEICFAPWHGWNGLTLEISESPEFPTRGATLQSTLTGFTTITKPLGEMKISSKSLVDGKTYYIRARGRYMIGGKSTKYTDYTPVWTFTYSSAVGVESIGADTQSGPAEYFNLQGIRVAEPQPGQPVIRRQGTTATKLIQR